MPFQISIPSPPGRDALQFEIGEGQIVFALGANGTGKSGLLQRVYSQYSSKARRISAQRQTWFMGNMPSMSIEQRRQFEQNAQNWDRNPQARWSEEAAQQRPTLAIFDLVEAENVRAREIAAAVDGDNLSHAQTLSRKDAPIKVINELLRLSNIPVAIFVDQHQGVLASRTDGAPYSVAKLSDGERNALLIAVNVLTAQTGTLILIDEPERHLHRSIISPLLTLLFAKRGDCAFFVSTHDVMLPLDNPSARTLLLRGCTYTGDAVLNWDADLLPAGAEIDLELKQDILGARRQILFVEGIEQSLDKPLYSLLFPNVSVVAKSSCRDVEHMVSAIREADSLHWLRAFGIVDGDRRVEADVDALRAKGVYAIAAFSIESIYYDPEIQRRVAERHASVIGGDAADRLAKAKSAAIAGLAAHKDRLSARVAEKDIREQFMSQLPSHSELGGQKSMTITVDVETIVGEARAHLEELITAGNLAAIVHGYPVRETPALAAIAKNLGFTNRHQYEEAVRKLLMDDGDALNYVRSLFGTLSEELSAI